MAHDLAVLLGPDGVARTTDLARTVDRHTEGDWVKARRLLRPYPGVVVLPAAFDQWRTRALVAVYVTDGLLSHTSALAMWRPAPMGDPVHVRSGPVAGRCDDPDSSSTASTAWSRISWGPIR